jgi:hypothetical protein
MTIIGSDFRCASVGFMFNGIGGFFVGTSALALVALTFLECCLVWSCLHRAHPWPLSPVLDSRCCLV